MVRLGGFCGAGSLYFRWGEPPRARAVGRDLRQCRLVHGKRAVRVGGAPASPTSRRAQAQYRPASRRAVWVRVTEQEVASPIRRKTGVTGVRAGQGPLRAGYGAKPHRDRHEDALDGNGQQRRRRPAPICAEGGAQRLSAPKAAPSTHLRRRRRPAPIREGGGAQHLSAAEAAPSPAFPGETTPTDLRRACMDDWAALVVT
jgi:hypothetical protein